MYIIYFIKWISVLNMFASDFCFIFQLQLFCCPFPWRRFLLISFSFCQKSPEIAANCRKLLKIAGNCWKSPKIAKNRQSSSKELPIFILLEKGWCIRFRYDKSVGSAHYFPSCALELRSPEVSNNHA